MQFNSIEFIFYFLPLFLAVYYIFPQNLRSNVLLIGSFAFYALACSGNYWWLLVLGLCTLFCYGAGRTLRGNHKKMCLVLYLSLLALLLINSAACADTSAPAVTTQSAEPVSETEAAIESSA